MPKSLFLKLSITLFSHEDEAVLRRLLSDGWVSDWAGWAEADSAIREAVGNGDDVAAEDCMRRFTKISLDNGVVRYQSDHQRRQQLSADGLRVGEGCVWQSNACLADSLLQLLCHHEVLTVPQFASDFQSQRS